MKEKVKKYYIKQVHDIFNWTAPEDRCNRILMLLEEIIAEFD